jgi:hypothetical protein
MADEFASLADTVVPPSAESTTPTDPKESTTSTVATEEKKVEASSEFTANPDAAEIGQILLNSGYSKEQLNDLLQAPKTLEAIQYQLRNNPVEFFQTIERNDPKTGEKVIEDLADLYVKRYGKKEGADDKGGDKQDAGLAAQITSLQERLTRQENERVAERNAAALAATRQRYQGRIDDLFGLKEVKELGLTKAESKAMRASLDVELGRDQGATGRILNGNFVDVPRVFKGIIDEWAADRKATAEAVTKARNGVVEGGFNEFTTGAELVSKLPTGTFDSWDATEEAFAKVLERTR